MCFGYRHLYRCNHWQPKSQIMLTFICDFGRALVENGKKPREKCPYFRYTPKFHDLNCLECFFAVSSLDTETFDKTNTKRDQERYASQIRHPDQLLMLDGNEDI